MGLDFPVVIDNKKIVEVFQFPYDKHLLLVRAIVEHENFTEHVTWIYNKSFKGFAGGNYFRDEQSAMEDFAERRNKTLS